MNPVPYAIVAVLAKDFNSVECYWRESKRSFTGFVAEVWFRDLPADFARKWVKTIKCSCVFVRIPAAGPGRFVVSVPVTINEAEITLSSPATGSRLKLTHEKTF
ncbi:MAG: hypothetical protein AAGG02_13885 [Cyanobacteria bacterium P01_H01_bin.15]